MQKKLLSRLIIVGLATILSCLPSLLFAQIITLYDQPTAGAKTAGKIDLSTGLIHIFTPEKSDWMKVGDPTNGNVGWVKKTDIQAAGGNSSVTFTQSHVKDGKEGSTFQFIQFGQGQQISPQKQQEMMQKLKEQQDIINKSLNEVVKELTNNQKDFEKEFPGAKPVILPIIVLPKPAPTPQNATPPTNPPSGNPVPNNEKVTVPTTTPKTTSPTIPAKPSP